LACLVNHPGDVEEFELSRPMINTHVLPQMLAECPVLQ